MFLDAISGRMSCLTPNEIQTVFSLLPDTVPCVQFKIALCKTLLSDTTESRAVPKPKPKAAPRPIPSHRQPKLEDQSNPSHKSSVETKPPSVARKYSTVTASEIVRLVVGTNGVAKGDATSTARNWYYKFLLLSTFARLQEVPSQKDDEWQQLLQNSGMARAIDAGLCCPDDATVQEQTRVQDLRAMLAVLGLYR